MRILIAEFVDTLVALIMVIGMKSLRDFMQPMRT